MAETFRDFEHRGWEDAAVCAQYDDYFERLTTQSIGALLDAVRVGSSDNVLDVATGPGYVAGFAASRAARVVGLDFSAQQLDLLAADPRQAMSRVVANKSRSAGRPSSTAWSENLSAPRGCVQGQ